MLLIFLISTRSNFRRGVYFGLWFEKTHSLEVEKGKDMVAELSISVAYLIVDQEEETGQEAGSYQKPEAHPIVSHYSC